jgi:hypothetical protein
VLEEMFALVDLAGRGDNHLDLELLGPVLLVEIDL